MNKIVRVVIVGFVLVSLILSGCTKKESKIEKAETKNMSWDEIISSSKGSDVYFYGWGGDPKINEWIDKVVAVEVKDKYDINLKRVPMGIDAILSKLLGEKSLKAKGTIDIIWINGENFFTARENDLLEGPFLKKLPNSKYLNFDDVELQYDFGYSIDEYEAPYGKAQFVFAYDASVSKDFPKNYKEFMNYIKENKGKVTYPAPPDFTGSAFVRNIIYDIVGHEQFINMEADYDIVKKEIMPAIKFLKEIKPYLWREGEVYPATLSQLDNMYSDGEVIMTMDYNPNKASRKIQEKLFKDHTKTDIFSKGSIGNTHFLAIPKNANNKLGSLVVINEILSPKLQALKYDPKVWGDLSVLDNRKLNESERELFENVEVGVATINQKKLLEKRLPEMPAKLIPIIERIWEDEILE